MERLNRYLARAGVASRRLADELIASGSVLVNGERPPPSGLLVDAEARIPEATRQELGRRGHQINVLDDWSWVVGGGQGIARDAESGALMAGADPRRDGYALAI